MAPDEKTLQFLSDLKEAHTRRLRALQIKAAQYGLECPVHISIEIEDIHEKLHDVDAQVKRVQRGASDTTSRRSVKREVLDGMVAEHLERQVTNKLEFTAYDVTLALRRAYPTLEINHSEVRHSVHLQLRLVVATGIYTIILARYGDDSAKRYIPTSTSV